MQEPVEDPEWKVHVGEPDVPVPPPVEPQAPVPPDVPERLQVNPLPELLSDEQPGPAAPVRRLPDERIYMDMKEVDLTVLLRTLARIAGQSIMISDNVSGTATINIQNQPWDSVFLSLLNTYGLSYEWEGEIIRVLTLADITNELRRLELKQQRESKLREIEAVAPLAQEVIDIEFASAENLRLIFEQLLGPGEGGRRSTVMVDPHTNALVVQASEPELEKIRELVAMLDRPTPQIRIEARIVEANSDTAKELGVEWGGLYKDSERDFWIAPGVDTSTGDPGEDQEETETGNLAVPQPGLIQELPAIITEGAGLNIGFIAQQVGQHILSVQLSALEREGKLNILSSPSISTLDNQVAIIESGREVPFQTVEDDDVNIEFKKAVLRLEVTPHVINGRIIKMLILTTKDELDFSNTVAGNPTVITKRAQTVVLLQDGQTTVIGGLRKETSSSTELGVPVLKDIPLLGSLFRRNSVSNDMEDILIFITPYILTQTGEFPVVTP